MMTEASFKTRFGPWALVAGASKGLGAAFAMQLAEAGLNLVLVARQADLLQSLADDIRGRYPVQVRTLTLDLSGEDAARQVLAQTSDLEVDLLIYNAASAPVARFFDLSMEDHLKILNTNMRTPLTLAYGLGHGMRLRHRGGIVLMSSLSALQGSALISHYAATKAYNLTLAEGLWDELRQEGVAVLACLPASIATPNYLASLPQGKQSPTQALLPEQVVRETLAALGNQSSVVPGWNNRLSAWVMRHLLGRQWAVRLMGIVLEKMYPQPGKTEN
jgi:short-subunit dehydrogenase